MALVELWEAFQRVLVGKSRYSYLYIQGSTKGTDRIASTRARLEVLRLGYSKLSQCMRTSDAITSHAAVMYTLSSPLITICTSSRSTSRSLPPKFKPCLFISSLLFCRVDKAIKKLPSQRKHSTRVLTTSFQLHASFPPVLSILTTFRTMIHCTSIAGRTCHKEHLWLLTKLSYQVLEIASASPHRHSLTNAIELTRSKANKVLTRQNGLN